MHCADPRYHYVGNFRPSSGSLQLVLIIVCNKMFSVKPINRSVEVEERCMEAFCALRSSQNCPGQLFLKLKLQSALHLKALTGYFYVLNSHSALWVLCFSSLILFQVIYLLQFQKNRKCINILYNFQLLSVCGAGIFMVRWPFMFSSECCLDRWKVGIDRISPLFWPIPISGWYQLIFKKIPLASSNV